MSAPSGYESNTLTVTIGDDRRVRRPCPDVPIAQGVAQATWTVKPLSAFYTPDPTNATAVWSKTINLTDNPNVGQIEDAGTVTHVAILRWDVSYLETSTLIPGVEYVYDMQVVSTAGKQDTFEKGMLIAFGQVTQS